MFPDSIKSDECYLKKLVSIGEAVIQLVNEAPLGNVSGQSKCLIWSIQLPLSNYTKDMVEDYFMRLHRHNPRWTITYDIDFHPLYGLPTHIKAGFQRTKPNSTEEILNVVEKTIPDMPRELMHELIGKY